ncbi:MAG: DUF5675 family protein [Ignavibacteria bacterium]|nr:DUF5675 family protein [Ignavibacteria bacterium]
MKITVERNYHTANITGSIIRDGGAVYYGIEPGPMHARGPIPCGVYKIGVRTIGEFHVEYATRFPAFHAGMLEVLNVLQIPLNSPWREAILIHCGNSFIDTKGCLLVGRQFKTGTLFESEKAYVTLYKSVIAAALTGELWIEYKNGGNNNA